MGLKHIMIGLEKIDRFIGIFTPIIFFIVRILITYTVFSVFKSNDIELNLMINLIFNFYIWYPLLSSYSHKI